MGTKYILSRQEACRYLGIAETATEEEVKRAYRLMAKQYHPDVNIQIDTKEVYYKIQEAYQFLLSHPYVAPPTVRQPRIFQTDTQVREQYRRQKRFEEERKKVLQREEMLKRQERKTASMQQSRASSKKKTVEEEALEKIRAIWLAETIHRQIEQDKEKKEVENRRKLYQAFMQQKINEEEEQRQKKSFWRKIK